MSAGESGGREQALDDPEVPGDTIVQSTGRRASDVIGRRTVFVQSNRVHAFGLITAAHIRDTILRAKSPQDCRVGNGAGRSGFSYSPLLAPGTRK